MNGALRTALDEYLVLRRGLGFKLDTLERLAGQYCDWLATHGKTDSFTIDDAITWARLPAGAARHWWGMRLSAVRTFAAYLHATGVEAPIIPAGLLPATSTRAAPTSTPKMTSTLYWPRAPPLSPTSGSPPPWAPSSGC